MKKVVSIMLIVFSMMLFSTSCKKMEADLVVTHLEGIGDYSSSDDTSAIKLETFIRIDQPTVAKDPLVLQLVQWKFTLFEGNRVVIQVDDLTLPDTLGAVTLTKSQVQVDFLWLTVDTDTRKTHDIYRGLNPDTLEFEAVAQDMDGNLYNIGVATNFQFTRD